MAGNKVSRLGSLSLLILSASVASGAENWSPVISQQISTSSFLTSSVQPKLIFSAAGDFYVAGQTPEKALAIARFDRDGIPVWTNYIQGSIAATNTPEALALDTETNLLVAAVSGGDFLVMKFSPLTGLLWTNSVTGTGVGIDVPAAIACDNAGNIYVTGKTYVSTTTPPLGQPYQNFSITTVSYDSAGGLRWRKDLTGSGYRQALDIAVDNLGKVYVACQATTTADPRAPIDQFELHALDSSTGSNALVFSGMSANTSSPNPFPMWSRLAMKAAGELVCAASRRTASAYNVTVRQFGTNQVQQWMTNSVMPLPAATTGLEVQGLTIDSLGNSYLLSAFNTNFSSACNIGLTKIDPNGGIAWKVFYDSPPHHVDRASSILPDATGNIFVAGTSSSGTSTSPFFAKFIKTGELAWTTHLGSYTNQLVASFPIRLDPCNRLRAAGFVPATSGDGFNTALLGYPHGPLTIARSENNQVIISFTGQPGTSNVLATSENLIDWTDLSNVNVDANGQGTYEIPATQPQQFLRCKCLEQGE